MKFVSANSYDEFELSTGKRFYANNGILGMHYDSCGIAYGYDGTVNDKDFTPAEKREIADYMIERWQEWRSKVNHE